MSRPRETFTRYRRPHTWAGAAALYEAGLTQEQRAKQPVQFREPTEDEDPFTLVEIAPEPPVFGPGED